MRIVVNKVIPKENKYKAGDVISLGNPYSATHYLLTNHVYTDVIGAINLVESKIEYVVSSDVGFEGLINIILKEKDWDEWALIKSENVTMKLDCKDGVVEQRNNSGSF